MPYKINKQQNLKVKIIRAFIVWIYRERDFLTKLKANKCVLYGFNLLLKKSIIKYINKKNDKHLTHCL